MKSGCDTEEDEVAGFGNGPDEWGEERKESQIVLRLWARVMGSRGGVRLAGTEKEGRRVFGRERKELSFR